MIEYFFLKIKIYLTRSAMQTNDLVKNSKCFGKNCIMDEYIVLCFFHCSTFVFIYPL